MALTVSTRQNCHLSYDEESLKRVVSRMRAASSLAARRSLPASSVAHLEQEYEDLAGSRPPANKQSHPFQQKAKDLSPRGLHEPMLFTYPDSIWGFRGKSKDLPWASNCLVD